MRVVPLAANEDLRAHDVARADVRRFAATVDHGTRFEKDRLLWQLVAAVDDIDPEEAEDRAADFPLSSLVGASRQTLPRSSGTSASEP